MKLEDIIIKKNNKKPLLNSEIEFAINGYVDGTFSDENFTPFIKAIYDNGMDEKETFYLTQTMKNSGEILDLSDLGLVVDKHSSGGVADNTTLIILPILASLGLKMLKMSGGGLGFTGGTADKVKVFEGLQNQLTIPEAKQLVKKTCGCFLTQSEALCPADKKIYALRDKTNLVDSIPLIASSIVSKKLACGAGIIILDVKYKDGAFMQNLSDAKTLAKLMQKLITMEGKKGIVVISSMDEPLGNFVGDELEVREAVSVLQNKNKNNLYKLSVLLASKLYEKAKNVSFEMAENEVINTIESGKAFEKLKEIVTLQKGNFDAVLKPLNAEVFEIKAMKSGIVIDILTQKLGFLSHELRTKYKTLVGVELTTNINEKITENNTLFKVYMRGEQLEKIDLEKFQNCIEIGLKEVKQTPLVAGIYE